MHMYKSVTKILEYTKGITTDQFLEQPVIQDACLSQFLIIGEAVKHVDNIYLEKYDYPWFKVLGFRNLLAHEYFSISLNAVWNIISNDLPGLKTIIETILKNEF